MTFDNVEKGIGETQFSANFYSDNSVMNIMRSRPADIMEQPTLPDQFTINLDLQSFRESTCQSRYDKTVSNDIAWTFGSNQYIYIRIVHRV